MTMQKVLPSAVFIFLVIASLAVASNGSLQHSPKLPSMADVVLNILPVTEVPYKNTRVRVYENKGNDFDEPRQWAFYYEPPMLPTAAGLKRIHNQLRVTLIVGNDDVEQKVLEAVEKKYDPSISKFSKSWTIAPLMIDGILAFITNDTVNPTRRVQPFRARNPKHLNMNLRFVCRDSDYAEEIRQSIMNGSLVIELGIKYSAMRRVQTNHIVISAKHLREVASKTAAEGGNANAKYVSRHQSKNFTSKYLEHLKNLIYVENPKSLLLLGVADMEKRFHKMFERGLSKLQDTEVEAELFRQIWSSDDFNPDVINRELNHRFTCVQGESGSSGNKVLQIDKRDASRSRYAGSASFLWFSASGEYDTSSDSQYAFKNGSSFNDFSRLLNKNGLKVEWDGTKFKVKAFNVLKLADLTSNLEMTMRKKVQIANKMQKTVFQTVIFDEIDKKEDSE